MMQSTIRGYVGLKASLLIFRIYQQYDKAGCCWHSVTDDGNISLDTITAIHFECDWSHKDCVELGLCFLQMKTTGIRKSIAVAEKWIYHHNRIFT